MDMNDPLAPAAGPIEALNAAVAAVLAGCDGSSACHGPGPLADALFGEHGPFWTRAYPFAEEAPLCRALDAVLQAVGAEQVVVGHTVQVRARPLSASQSEGCDSRTISGAGLPPRPQQALIGLR